MEVYRYGFRKIQDINHKQGTKRQIRQEQGHTMRTIWKYYFKSIRRFRI